MPRDEAYQQLTDYFLPSPEDVFVTADKAEYSGDDKLHGASIENIWGSDVDIAASLYSTGWGGDCSQEAIIAIAVVMQEIRKHITGMACCMAGLSKD